MQDPRIELLLRFLEQAYERRSWHGPNLSTALKGVSVAQAAFRPSAERHNIWELALHAAYWKYRISRQISERSPRSFELVGSNFFERPAGHGEDTWRSDRRLLRTWHQRLVAAVTDIDPAQLERPVGKDARFTLADRVAGVASHDLYHAGQIMLLRRLAEDAGIE